MNADLYHKNYQIELDTALICLDKYGSKIKWKEADNKIIDIGTGEGTVISRLRKCFPRDVTVLGSDIDKRMVELASEHYRDEQTSFIILDIEGDLPPTMKGSYSHVFSFYCLNWVKDQEKAFNNIYNLLEPDGECFLLIIKYTAIFDIFRNLKRTGKWQTWVYDVERYISAYCDSQEPEKEIKTLMKKTGFDNIGTEYDHMFYTYDDMETMKGSLLALCPFKIPSDKIDDFWDDYVEKLKIFKGCDDTTKNIKYNFKILTEHAHKPGNVAES